MARGRGPGGLRSAELLADEGAGLVERPVVLHVITRFARGGSEQRLVDIVTALPEADGGYYMRASDVLGLPSRSDGPPQVLVQAAVELPVAADAAYGGPDWLNSSASDDGENLTGELRSAHDEIGQPSVRRIVDACRTVDAGMQSCRRGHRHRRGRIPFVLTAVVNVAVD
jgi:hypothetical protein